MISNSRTASLKSSTNKSARELFSSIRERAASQTSLLRQQSSSWFSKESEPSLPVPDITHPLPVMERPSRVLLKSLNRDHFNGPYTLSSTKKGDVHVSTAEVIWSNFCSFQLTKCRTPKIAQQRMLLQQQQEKTCIISNPSSSADTLLHLLGQNYNC